MILVRPAAIVVMACAVVLSGCSSNSAPATEGGEGRDGKPAVEADGRSYSYKRTMSMEVPEHWYYQETPFDDLSQSDEARPTDFLGMWIPDGNEITGTTTIMIMHVRPEPGTTAATAMDEDFGSVGNVSTDEMGRTITVVGEGTLSLDDGTAVRWVDAEMDNGDGYPYVMRVYHFDTPQGGYVSVYVSTVAYQEEFILAEVEAALGTIETYALP